MRVLVVCEESQKLSKQICEICGIPHTKIMKFILDNSTTKIYLDFSEPTNFVKLFELPLKDNYIMGGFINENFIFSNRETFLKSLKLAFLKKPSIKQAIREAEWKYE